MATVEKTIQVKVPVNTAYNQWTQFEEFPRFMEGVKEVRQLDDKHLQWCADIGGHEERWEAEITSQVPDEKIAWRSITGAENAGIVTFEPLGSGTTEVHLRIEYQPAGIIETAGNLLGMVSRRVEGDLERFKDFVEMHGDETGSWRGHIHAGEVKDGSDSGSGASLGSASASGSSMGNPSTGDSGMGGASMGSASMGMPDPGSSATGGSSLGNSGISGSNPDTSDLNQ